jgi:hypothetical protein
LKTKNANGDSVKQILIGQGFGKPRQVKIRRWLVSKLAVFQEKTIDKL